jgi:hypothetical protein
MSDMENTFARDEIVHLYAELFRITQDLGAIGRQVEALAGRTNEAMDALAAHHGINHDEVLAALDRPHAPLAP